MISIISGMAKRLIRYHTYKVPRATFFNETITANNLSQLNYSSFVGVSDIRDELTFTGDGSQQLTDGEIHLSTGAASNSSVKLNTIQRGHYQAGTQGEVGVGLRLSALPTGDQEVIWGYFDDDNGFGWGFDAQGLFGFARRNGVETHRTYRSSFSEDPFDGTAPENAVLNPLGGHIYLIDFAWYGYGAVRWSLQKQSKHTEFNSYKNNHLGHTYDPSGDADFSGVSVVTPNLPITVEVRNGASGGNFDAFVGGRKFSIIGGNNKTARRLVMDAVQDFTLTAGEGNWQPIMALRPRDTFQGIRNGTNVRMKGATFMSDQDCTFRTTIGADLTGSTFSLPESYPDTETSAEIAKTTDISFTSEGYRVPPFSMFRAGTNNSKTFTTNDENVTIPLSPTLPATLWARQDSTTPPVISAEIEWTEDF